MGTAFELKEILLQHHSTKPLLGPTENLSGLTIVKSSAGSSSNHQVMWTFLNKITVITLSALNTALIIPATSPNMELHKR